LSYCSAEFHRLAAETDASYKPEGDSISKLLANLEFHWKKTKSFLVSLIYLNMTENSDFGILAYCGCHSVLNR
jgi:hypothetical protein